ncbi:MAG: hypothetical protein V4572_06600 [Bacteroidota bacterium]
MALEKFEIDIKWGSYFVIVNLIISITIALFILVIFPTSFEDRYNSKFLSSFLIMLFVIQLFYFVRKAIKENKKYQTIRFFAKVSIFLRVLCFYSFIVSLKYISPQITSLELNSILKYRKNNLSEFLIDDDEMKENKSNW